MTQTAAKKPMFFRIIQLFRQATLSANDLPYCLLKNIGAEDKRLIHCNQLLEKNE